jgi:hypothetical protein
MRKLWIVLILVVSGILVVSYAMYSLQYKGNYNFAVSVKLNVSDERTIALTEFTSSSSETGVLQFWDQLKGPGTSPTEGYLISWQLTQGVDTVSLISRCLVPLGESKVLQRTFTNVNPGEADLKITIRDAFNASLFEKTYSVVVG